MRPALRQASTLLAHDVHASLPVAPPFVLACRAQLPTDYGIRRIPRPAYRFSTCRNRRQQSAVVAPSSTSDEIPPRSDHASPPAPIRRSLPRTCPGCGAPAHTQEKNEAGFYNTDRHVVRNYLDGKTSQLVTESEEDEVYAKALRDANPELLEQLGVENGTTPEVEEIQTSQTPVCDRCHNLIHHRVGSEIHHPSIDAIQQTIAESPHRRNHIYHVIDAADFPLSIVPNLQSTLRIPKLRTQNRRAKHKGWVANDRIAEVSFIITRADLLAPKKEQVDAMMPYFQEVLRDALGRTNNKARLGNVRLVSAKRGWWTKQVKEDIWERGGAGWMVGKVNVGKSNLFEVVFPKGRGADYQDVRKIRSAAERDEMLNSAQSLDELVKVQQQLAKEDAETERLKNRPSTHLHQPPRELEEDQLEEEDFDDPDALLPPPQAYTPYPVLPVASSRPGTTASPIRIPFGRNRGELIDLPGLARTTPGLETFVRRDEHDSLVMKSRINSERFTLKPGQSLILGGGLIRITPTTQDLVFLVHPFVPIHPHVTRTDKAIEYQNQTSDRQLQDTPILAQNIGSKMASAGKFPLKWDVTKKLAGPVTSPVAGKMRPENLPFRIWSTDILVEGVGWIEVSAQTRRPQGWTPIGMAKKDPNHAAKAKLELAAREKARQQRKFDILARAEREGVNADFLLAEEMDKERLGDEMAEWEQEYPEVEVFSPLGKFVGQRRPMCASLVSGPKRVASRDRKVRPRRSMVSVKRQRRPQGT